MASLRLTFPEKSQPSIIPLTGSRVTIGRLPLNTIQIIDRTLSGFHAELVLEDEHYRLHDRGSTNGTFVNGEQVTDYHLREACKISFGVLECEFTLDTPATAEDANVEALPTRSEINAVRQENAELKNRAEALREELDALNKARAAESGSNTVAVAKDEYEKLVADREALKESQHQLQIEIERLQTDLSLLQRDREILKTVADGARAELDTFRTPPARTESPAVSDAPAAAKDEEKPAPSDVQFETEAPAARTAVPAPPSKPAFPPGAKPAPKPPITLPTVPAKGPVPTGSGIRTMPPLKPAVSVRPAPATPAAPAQNGPAPAPAGKGSTQKIDLEAAAAPPKPIVSGPKPPIKLPMQPTTKPRPGAVPMKPQFTPKPIGKDPPPTENASG